jgi:TonB family protein
VEEIGKAKSAGVGTTAYEAALSEIENEWKNGAEPAAVNNKILVLRTRIADQIAQQKFLRLSAGKSIMVGGKKDAEVNPAHFATFIAGVEAKMKSVWRPCGRDSGVVRLRFDVSENGNVGNAKVFMTSGIECLDDAAMCALAASQPLDTGPITEAFRKEKVVSIDFAYRYHVN